MHIFSELEITPAGAVPFRLGDVVQVARLQQSGLRFQRTAFGETIFQLRGETAAEILLNSRRRLFGGVGPSREGFVARAASGEFIANS